MSINTSTIKSISDSIISKLEQSLNTKFPSHPKSFTRTLARSIASTYIMQTHYANYIEAQQFVSTCASEDIEIFGYTINPLDFWGGLVGIDGRKMGTRCELSAKVVTTGTAIASTLDAGTQLISAQNGFVYITSQAYAITGTDFAIDLIAANDEAQNNGIGAAGNLQIGDILTFVNAPTIISKEAAITAIIKNGADAEDPALYRSRIIAAFKRRKQGGAYIDYKLWGEETPGIVKVYPYTGPPGEMNIYSEATVASSGNADGIPTSTQLVDVKNHIELDINGKASRRPADTFINSLPIFRTGFKVQVIGLQVVDKVAVEASIKKAVTDFFLQSEPFIEGLSIAPRLDIISNALVSSVIVDIVQANNGYFAEVLTYVYSTNVPVNLYQLSEGEKAKLAGIIFT